MLSRVVYVVFVRLACFLSLVHLTLAVDRRRDANDAREDARVVRTKRGRLACLLAELGAGRATPRGELTALLKRHELLVLG